MKPLPTREGECEYDHEYLALDEARGRGHVPLEVHAPWVGNAAWWERNEAERLERVPIKNAAYWESKRAECLKWLEERGNVQQVRECNDWLNDLLFFIGETNGNRNCSGDADDRPATGEAFCDLE